ncbi:MAG: chemotaxis protein CheW [Rubrivivax sp.]|nr:chemotaxis protein CheW [Rubrivivax sp.]
MTPQTTSSAGAAGRPQGSMAAAAGEYLAFKLGAEEYGIDILRVQEIRSFEAPTRIADAPAHVLGVQNLRGVIVPIVDLRLRLGMAEPGYGSLTVVIVLNIGPRVIGMVVDGVSDVIRLGADQLRPVPEFNSAVASEHLLAIGAIDRRMLILIDIEKLATSPEMGLVESAPH